jgi:hypothetical protein
MLLLNVPLSVFHSSHSLVSCRYFIAEVKTVHFCPNGTFNKFISVIYNGFLIRLFFAASEPDRWIYTPLVSLTR